MTNRDDFLKSLMNEAAAMVEGQSGITVEIDEWTDMPESGPRLELCLELEDVELVTVGSKAGEWRISYMALGSTALETRRLAGLSVPLVAELFTDPAFNEEPVPDWVRLILTFASGTRAQVADAFREMVTTFLMKLKTHIPVDEKSPMN